MQTMSLDQSKKVKLTLMGGPLDGQEIEIEEACTKETYLIPPQYFWKPMVNNAPIYKKTTIDGQVQWVMDGYLK